MLALQKFYFERRTIVMNQMNSNNEFHSSQVWIAICNLTEIKKNKGCSRFFPLTFSTIIQSKKSTVNNLAYA